FLFCALEADQKDDDEDELKKNKIENVDGGEKLSIVRLDDLVGMIIKTTIKEHYVIIEPALPAINGGRFCNCYERKEISLLGEALHDYRTSVTRRILQWFSNFAGTGESEHRKCARTISQISHIY
ncbi:hypothetical protein C5167_022970, partial [Papaver somniferum]